MMKSKSILGVVLAAVAMGVAVPAAADSDRHHYQQHGKQYISYERAAQIAVKRAGGGYANNVDFEYKGGKRAYFEVEVEGRHGQEYDVVIDARSGRVLSFRRED